MVEKKDTFPILHRVAIRIHCTPASNTSSERNFSKLKFIIDDNIVVLKDDILDALTYLRDDLDY